MVQKLKLEIDSLKVMRTQDASNTPYQRNGSPRSGLRPQSFHVQATSDNIDGAPVGVPVEEDNTPT